MLNDILLDKSHCDGIGLKPFLQVVSLISKLKVCLQRVYNIGGMSAIFYILGVKEFRCYCV